MKTLGIPQNVLHPLVERALRILPCRPCLCDPVIDEGLFEEGVGVAVFGCQYRRETGGILNDKQGQFRPDILYDIIGCICAESVLRQKSQRKASEAGRGAHRTSDCFDNCLALIRPEPFSDPGVNFRTFHRNVPIVYRRLPFWKVFLIYSRFRGTCRALHP